MKRWLLLGWILAACSGGQLDEGASEQRSEDEANQPKTIQPEAGEQPEELPPAQTWVDDCSGQGQFDFRIAGDSFNVWNGKRVTVSALEFKVSEGGSVLTRPARLFATIRDGKFSVSCPRALTVTYASPSWALYVDLDEDGHCSPGDPTSVVQLHGWSKTVSETVTPDFPWDSISATGDGPPDAMTFGSASYCTSYFE